MNETIEQPAAVEAPIPQTETASEPDTLSVTEHHKTFGPNATTEAVDAEAERQAHHSEQQKREKDTGRFDQGKTRARSKDLVTRVDQLTSNWRMAERERDEARAELTRLRTTNAAPATIERAEQRVEQTQQGPKVAAQARPSGFAEPEPQEDDPRFEGDYTKFVRALGAWEGKKAAWEFRQGEHARSQQDQQNAVWDKRIAAATAKYPDYLDAARAVMAKIPANSAIHPFVEDDESGEDVLYYLHSNPQELDAILRLSTVQQIKTVSLLSQRFSASSTASTGAVSTSPRSRQSIVLPPKPPNVERTGVQRTSDAPPTDGTLSVTGHRKAFHRQ